MTTDTATRLARITNAALLPAVAIGAMLTSMPAHRDLIWTAIVVLLGLWLIRRLWRAFDYERPYKFRSLKLAGWTLAFASLLQLGMRFF